MRKKLKPFNVLIIGILIITAFVRGPALDITLGIFIVSFLIYSIIRNRIKKKGTSTGKTYKINLTPTMNKFLKCAMILRFRGGMLNAISKIIR